MIRAAAIRLAKAGRPVRQSIWPSGETLIFYRDIGSKSAVACKRKVVTTSTATTITVTPITNLEFGQAQWNATDWVEA